MNNKSLFLILLGYIPCTALFALAGISLWKDITSLCFVLVLCGLLTVPSGEINIKKPNPKKDKK